jgi:uncharacterized protein DUF3455
MFAKRVALLVGLAIALTGRAYAAGPITPPAVPADIQVPEGLRPFFVAHAIGTQNFICVPAPTPSGVDWIFIGPQATGFNGDFEQIITHAQSVNPVTGTIDAVWQGSKDTSAAWAVKDRESSDPNYVTPGAIPWLRLRVTGAQLGPLGGDKLTLAKYIQRVNTVAGAKPALSDCTPSAYYTRKLVYYEADYYFYR